MAWYAYNGQTSRFGATRFRLEQSTASAGAGLTVYEYQNGAEKLPIRATLYTCDSSGTLTQRAVSAPVSGPFGFSNVQLQLTVPTGIVVPSGGGVALRVAILSGATERDGITFFTPPQTGSVIAAGTHLVTVRYRTDYEYDWDESHTAIYYGASNTYAPDTICASGTPPVSNAPIHLLATNRVPC